MPTLPRVVNVVRTGIRCAVRDRNRTALALHRDDTIAVRALCSGARPQTDPHGPAPVPPHTTYHSHYDDVCGPT